MRNLTVFRYLILACAVSFSTCTSLICSKNNSGISTITGSEECSMEARNPANDPNGPKKQITIVGARDEFLHCCLQDLNSTILDINKAILVRNSNFTLPKLVAELKNHAETLNTLTIYFEMSHLFEIPRDSFGYFRSIRKIVLDGNGIEKLVTESFLNLKKLLTINLAHNSITVIPRQAFSGLPKLRSLDLSFNKILSFCADAFHEIPNLSFIDLEDNSLTVINFTMFQNSSLSEINLSYNNLTAINDDIRYIPGIEQLYLDHNQLTYLSQEICDMSRLEVLKIDHNPWVCDCELKWLIELAIQLSIADEVYCSIPANTSMQIFNESESYCVSRAIEWGPKQHEDESVIFVFLAVGGIILIVCVLTSLGCLWKRRRREKSANDKSQMCITPVQLSPCGMVPNSNYSRLFSNSPTASASSTTHVNKSKLKVGKLLGRGAFGEVYEGFSGDVEDGNKMVAIKMIRESSSLQNYEALEQEFKQLTQIDKHSYIIQVFSIGKIEGSFVMVMEMAKYGDLLTYLRKMYEREEHVINSLDSSEEKYYLLNDQPRLFSFMWNVAKGMEYLSCLKILHRDLAARNILLCSGPVAKIADFGLSRDVYESGYYYQDTQGRLPYKWLSPEALINGKSTLKSDVWSFGILMWEMVTLGSNPYPGIPPCILVDMYRNSYIMPQPPLCPDDIYAIMQKCWDYCVDTRPHFTRILEMLDSFIQTAPNVESLTDEKEVDESHHLISDIHIE